MFIHCIGKIIIFSNFINMINRKKYKFISILNPYVKAKSLLNVINNSE